MNVPGVAAEQYRAKPMKPPRFHISDDTANRARILFGSSARWIVGWWIAVRQSPVFCSPDFFDEVKCSGGFTPSSLQSPLRTFEQLGIIAPADTSRPADGRKYYRRLPSPLWALLESAGDALGAPSLKERRPPTPAEARALLNHVRSLERSLR